MKNIYYGKWVYLVVIFGIDTISAAKFFSDWEFSRIGINTDNSGCSCLYCTHNNCQTDSTKTPNSYSRTWFSFCRVQDSTVACWNTTSKKTNLLTINLFSKYYVRLNTLSCGAFEFTAQTETPATTVYCENVEHPIKWKSSLPLHLKREVPSGILPAPWVALTAWQRFVFGFLQNLQLRH